MLRCGPPVPDMHPTSADDIFLERLKLLIIMAKAFLKGFPQGDFRSSAIRENADFVYNQSLGRSCPPQGQTRSGLGAACDERIHLLHQRAQLLAIMARSFADNQLWGSYRRRALSENIAAICSQLSEQFRLDDAPFLKVA